MQAILDQGRNPHETPSQIEPHTTTALQKVMQYRPWRCAFQEPTADFYDNDHGNSFVLSKHRQKPH